jgi:uncharacterized protein
LPRIEFAASDGTALEGTLTIPDGEPAGAAVVCHPHPEYGGSMDSWMMPVLHRAVVGAGWVGLRFNFRGVGRSAGSFGGGEDELEDVAGAIDRALEEVGPAGSLLLGGWSFGAQVTLRQALEDERVSGWFGVALPLPLGYNAGAPDDLERLARWSVPKLFVHGTRDQLTPSADIEELVAAAADPKQLRLIEGGDHFLAQHGDVLAEEVRTFAESLG